MESLRDPFGEFRERAYLHVRIRRRPGSTPVDKAYGVPAALGTVRVEAFELTNSVASAGHFGQHRIDSRVGLVNPDFVHTTYVIDGQTGVLQRARSCPIRGNAQARDGSREAPRWSTASRPLPQPHEARTAQTTPFHRSR